MIRFGSLFKSELRTLLLNSGNPQSSLDHLLNSGLQGSPKFTRAFKYVDDLPLPGADSLHALSDWKDAVKESIRMATREDGWALLSDVGNKLKEIKPALKFRDYCHGKLLPLIESCKEEFETGPERVRLRPPV